METPRCRERRTAVLITANPRCYARTVRYSCLPPWSVMLSLSLACLLGAEAFGPPAFGSPMRARRPIAMSAAAGASPAVGLGLGSRVLLGQDGPLLPRKAGICADTYAPEPPYGPYGLRLPVSCVLCVPEAQGSLPRRGSHGTKD